MSKMQLSNRHLYAAIAATGLGKFMHEIVNNSEDLNDADKQFILSYIQRSIIPLCCLILAFVFLLLGMGLYSSTFARVSANIFLIARLILTIMSRYYIINNKKMIYTDDSSKALKSSLETNKKHIIYYLPYYNMYRWIKGDRNIILQESILVTYVCYIITIIVVVIGPNVPSEILIGGFGLYIARLVSLGVIGNTYPANKKKLLSHIHNHPEQLWSYIKGPLLYIRQQIKKKKKNVTIHNFISAVADEYNVSHNNYGEIKYQLILLFLLFTFIIWKRLSSVSNNLQELLSFLIVTIILFRYGLSIYYKKIPNIPIFYELEKRLITKFNKQK